MESMTHILQTEVRLMTEIAAGHWCNIYKTDTKQAFLYDDLENDEPIYIALPDCWLEPVPEGHVLQLLTAVSGTVRAARRWHTKISIGWSIANTRGK